MPLDEFWHGDTRLLQCYQTAYYRQMSYNSWMQGKFNHDAYAIVLHNAFEKESSKHIQYPEWKDPIETAEKQKAKQERTAESVEIEFRQQQIEANAWLESLIMNRKRD